MNVTVIECFNMSPWLINVFARKGETHLKKFLVTVAARHGFSGGKMVSELLSDE